MAITDSGGRSRPLLVVLWSVLIALGLGILAASAFLFFPDRAGARTMIAVQSRSVLTKERFSALERDYDARVLRVPGAPVEAWSVPSSEAPSFTRDVQMSQILAQFQSGSAQDRIDEILGPPILGPPDRLSLTTRQQDILTNIRGDSRRAPLILQLQDTQSLNALTEGRAPQAFAIQLDAQRSLALAPRDVHVTENGLVWRGEVAGGGNAFLLVQGSDISGFIRADGTTYTFRPLGDGLHALIQDEPREGPEERPGFEREAPIAPPMEANDLPPGLSQISVLVAHTPSAAASYTDIARDYIRIAVSITNESFRSSGLESVVHVNLAGVRRVNYNEVGTWKQHLDRLVASRDGVMDELHTARRDTRADIVVLLVRDRTWCGEAASIGPIRERAFALVSVGCELPNYSFTHELGHLFGLRHDVQVDSANTPYPLGHGFLLPACRVRTLMAYPNACPQCDRIDRWSDPNAQYCGRPFGSSTQEFEVSVIPQTAHVISTFN